MGIGPVAKKYLRYLEVHPPPFKNNFLATTVAICASCATNHAL